MKRRELADILNRLQMHPSKALGQNFLVDENCLDALAREANPQPGEAILEVGPGLGALTQRLLQAGSHVTAIEFDSRLAAYLRQKWGSLPHFQLREEDAGKTDYDALFPQGTPYRCVANLPYSCASVILARMTSAQNPPKSLHVLLQKEMAERLAAQAGTPQYGLLTVRLAFQYQARLARPVPRGVFFPPPEVDSAFLALEARPTPLAPPDLREKAARLAAAAFAQRRKQARKLLEPLLPNANVTALLEELGLPPTARAEVITPQQYILLAQADGNRSLRLPGQ